MEANSTLFISTMGLRGLPFLEQYEKCFDEPYDLLVWETGKNGNGGHPRANVIRYSHNKKTSIEKALGYWGFKRFTEQYLKHHSYSKLVLLYTQPAALLAPLLAKDYSGRYICDIRDYSLEHVPWFRKREQLAIRNSWLNVVSSAGYLNFLPEGENYALLHNSHGLEALKRREKPENRPITIGNIGGIRFHNQCRLFIEKFGGDERFRLLFCGVGAEGLKLYCSDLDLSRVTFIDSLLPEETGRYLRQCDLLFNLYGNHTPLLDYALSNRLYYCAEYGIPILTCPDTFMHTIEERYHLGFCVDLEQDNPNDALYEAYGVFDFEVFDKGRAEFLDICLEDNRITLELLTQFLSSGRTISMD